MDKDRSYTTYNINLSGGLLFLVDLLNVVWPLAVYSDSSVFSSVTRLLRSMVFWFFSVHWEKMNEAIDK